MNPQIQRLLEANPIREPVLRQAARSLHLPPGSHGLDLGCGIGLQTLLLLEGAGGDGHVSGVDIDPQLLAYAAGFVQQAGLADRISFHQGSASRIPFPDAAFDWAWSADCVGYPAGDLAPLLAELQRVVKPGGIIALLAWTSQQVLPGYPLLEARLNATCSSYLPYLAGKPPQQHFLRALHSFAQAGLGGVTARTFVGDVQAPLSAAQRAALVGLIEMLWSEPDPEDREEYLRLCRPGSPDFILDQPGYYAFFTYTMFWGIV